MAWLLIFLFLREVFMHPFLMAPVCSLRGTFSAPDGASAVVRKLAACFLLTLPASGALLYSWLVFSSEGMCPPRGEPSPSNGSAEICTFPPPRQWAKRSGSLLLRSHELKPDGPGSECTGGLSDINGTRKY